MKQIVIILLLSAIAVFGFFAYKSFKTSAVDLSKIDKEDVKGFIDGGINKVKQSAQDAADQAIQEAKNQAADALKNKVDEVLGTE